MFNELDASRARADALAQFKREIGELYALKEAAFGPAIQSLS
ncbi:hypothetical protein GGQ82_000581 [Sphingobium olei]